MILISNDFWHITDDFDPYNVLLVIATHIAYDCVCAAGTRHFNTRGNEAADPSACS